MNDSSWKYFGINWRWCVESLLMMLVRIKSILFIRIKWIGFEDLIVQMWPEVVFVYQTAAYWILSCVLNVRSQLCQTEQMAVYCYFFFGVRCVKAGACLYLYARCPNSIKIFEYILFFSATIFLFHSSLSTFLNRPTPKAVSF